MPAELTFSSFDHVTLRSNFNPSFFVYVLALPCGLALRRLLFWEQAMSSSSNLPWPWNTAINHGSAWHGHNGYWTIPENTHLDSKVRCFVFWATGVMPAARGRIPHQRKTMTVAGFSRRLGEAFWLAREICRNRGEWDLERGDRYYYHDVRCGCPERFIHGGQADRWQVHLTQPNLRWRQWMRQDGGGWRLSPPDAWDYLAPPMQQELARAITAAIDDDDGSGGEQYDGDAGGDRGAFCN